MFGLMAFISMVFSVKEIIKEKTEPVSSSTSRFDWDTYYKDIDKLSVKEQMKKVERGGYWVAK